MTPTHNNYLILIRTPKLLLILFLITSAAWKAQKKPSSSKETITAQEALKSDDLKVIAAFVRSHPNDPATPQLKSKLLKMIKPDEQKRSSISASREGAPSSTTFKKNHTKNAPHNSSSAKADEETAQILNHLFSNDASLKNAFLQITNQSNCDITVKLVGRNKNYTLIISKSSKKHILIEKGEYLISSQICDAAFATHKNIQKDITMVLGN